MCTLLSSSVVSDTPISNVKSKCTENKHQC